MQCPMCNANTNPGAKFCPRCGYDISQQAQGAALAPTQVMQSTACPNCGTALSLTSKFCPNCGTTMGAGASFSGGPVYSGKQSYGGGQGYAGSGAYQGQGQSPASAAKRSGKLPVIIGAIVLVALVGGAVAAYFLIFNKPSAITPTNVNGGPAATASPLDVAKAFFTLTEGGKEEEAIKLFSSKALSERGEWVRTGVKDQIKMMSPLIAQGRKYKPENEKQTVNGDTAKVYMLYRSAEHNDAGPFYFSLVKENGEWKINDINGNEAMSDLHPETTSSTDRAEYTETADVADQFIRAMDRGDLAEIESLYSSMANEREKKSAESTSQSIRKLEGIESIQFKKGIAQGDDVTIQQEVKYRAGRVLEWTISLEKENGAWRVRYSLISPLSHPPPPPPPPTPGNTNSGSTPSSPKIIRKSGGVLANEAIRKVEPVYPPLAKAARVSGSVVVEVIVDEQGNVTSARALSGHPLLKDAAVSAARQWEFKPTLLSGSPVKVIGTITFNFNL